MNILGFKISRENRDNRPQKAKKSVRVNEAKVYAGRGNAQLVSAFQHGLNLRANTMSRARLVLERKVGHVWREDVQGISGAREMRHLVYMLQVRPSEYENAIVLWRMLSYYRDVEGSAAIWLPNGLASTKCFVVHGLSQDPSNNTYSFMCDTLNSSYASVDAKNLIVLRGVPRIGSRLGDSIVDVACQSLSLSLTGDDFTTKTLAKGGAVKMFVSEQQQTSFNDLASYDDDEVKTAVDDVRDQVAQNDDVIFLQGDLKVEQRSQSFQDMQVDLTSKRCTEDIARYLGIPLPLMFCATNAVYKSIDDAWHTFKELTIEPILAEIASEMNSTLLGEVYFNELRFRFDTTAICLDSENVKAQAASSRRSSGVTTANEERALLGLAPLDGGDELATPRNNNKNNIDNIQDNG